MKRMVRRERRISRTTARLRPADGATAGRAGKPSACPERSREGGRVEGFLLVGYVGMVLTLPLWFAGFPFPTHDGELHLRWYENFSAQFLAGELYPRWLLNMNGGRGSPVFFFYPPIPYYLTSLVTLPLSSRAEMQLGIGAAVALIASGLTACRWLSGFVDRPSAVLGSILYMAWPYHLAVDLYRRGAYAEFWSFVWLPLLLRSAQGLAAGNSRAGPALAAGFAALLMTHPPTALIFAPWPVLLAIWTAQPGCRSKAGVTSLAGLVLGFGLSAIYLVPALATQDHVQMDVMHSGEMHFTRSFLWPGLTGNGANPSRFSEELFPLMVIMGLVGGLAGIGVVWVVPEHRCLGWFLLVVLLISLGMMVPPAEAVYWLIPLLQRIQFPWRFGVVAVVSSSALVALGGAGLRTLGHCRLANLSFAALILAVLVVSFPSVRTSAFGAWPREPLLMNDSQLMARDAPEYLPRWAAPDALAGAGVERANRLRFIGGPDPLSDAVPSAQLLRWEPRRVSFWFKGDSEAVLVLGHFYYPGWQAQTDRGEVLEVTPSLKQGLIQFSIPAGSHQVELVLERSLAERWGQAVSLISLILGMSWRRFSRQ